MLKNGRYGPYVAHNGVNATLPKDMEPDEVTIDDALVLLAKKTGNNSALNFDVAAELKAAAETERSRLVEKVAKQKTDTERREERFIALLQAAMEIDLDDCRAYDLKERNALYLNCVRFLAVINKFKDGDGDGSFFDD
jgi:pyocin large subunit-like protein